jgi:protein O-mannosyl-transferase
MKSTRTSARTKAATNPVKRPALSDKWRNNIIIGLIITFTFIVFCKALGFQFVLWDDNFYVQDNLLIRDISIGGLKKILTSPVIGMYNPLTFILYALIYKFWGLAPGAFHFFNIFFHLVAIITIYKFIFRLTKRYETATIVALFFAIHPMHVGVVTWVSELKTSLYLVFYFWALINYLKYIQNNYKAKYIVYTALLFILSALSKPSAITLAPMLFLLDYYLSRKIDKRLFLEKIPFFLVAIFFGILTLYTHSDIGDTIFDVKTDYSLINNILISNYSIVFYFNKLFAPFDLCTIYPYPANDTFLPLKYYLSIPVIPLLLWIVYKARKFRKELIFGLLFFIIAISVLVKIVPTGFFMVANRYTYLSYTGLFFIIGQFFTYVLDHRFSYSEKIKTYLFIFLSALVILYTYQTAQRVKVWENSITLFDDIIQKKPALPIAYHNRALARQQRGDAAGAVADLENAVRYDPKYASAYNLLGEIKEALNNEDEALINYNKALAVDPEFALAYNNRGIIMSKRNKFKEAVLDFNMALKLDPGHGPAFHNRGLAKLSLGDTVGAIEDWKRSAALQNKESLRLIEIFAAGSKRSVNIRVK